MTIVEIAASKNGAHRNQTGGMKNVPEGWAVVPAGMVLDNFPFGDLETEVVDGVMTVTNWIPRTDTEAEPTE